jgi:outer membrane immunogenic protein
MKRFIALPIVVLASVALIRIVFAGPEPLSGKEMKQVAPEPLPECNWTGFHIGIHGGYDWGDMQWIDSDNSIFPSTGGNELPETLSDQEMTGFFGGLQLGYDYQWHSLVFGIEGEFSYSEAATKALESFGNTNHDRFWVRSDWTGSFAGRVGYAWHKFLLYGKGGGVVAHIKAHQNHPPDDVFRADDTRWAPMAGVGLEYMINCNWSMKLEYRHDFYGRQAIDGTLNEAIDSTGGGGPEHETYDIDMTHNTLQFGLNYRF